MPAIDGVKARPARFDRPSGRWYKPLATAFTKFRVGYSAPCRRSPAEGEDRVEWANLPHDYAETLELVFVGISIVIGLAVMVAFGQWWQK
jgi:hypothetical protein